MEFTEKQLQLMNAALEVFATKGYEKATIRDIAKHAKVNIAMISYYFGSKDKLLEAIFKNYMEKMNSKITSIITSKTLDPFEKVNLLVDNYIDAVLENKHFHRLMIREGMLLKDGQIYDYIKGMKFQNKNLLSTAVKQGQKKGIFQKNVDVMMLSTILLGSVNQVFSNNKFIAEAYNIDYHDFELYKEKVIENLRQHIKIIFKSYLTLNINQK